MAVAGTDVISREQPSTGIEEEDSVRTKSSRSGRQPAPTLRRLATIGAIGLAAGVITMPASAAQADTLAECQAKLLNGQIDLNQYLACPIGPPTSQISTTASVAPTNVVRTTIVFTASPLTSTSSTNGTLPVTGTNDGRLVAVGAALLVLGSAATYGATARRRRDASGPNADPRDDG